MGGDGSKAVSAAQGCSQLVQLALCKPDWLLARWIDCWIPKPTQSPPPGSSRTNQSSCLPAHQGRRGPDIPPFHPPVLRLLPAWNIDDLWSPQILFAPEACAQ